MSLVQMMTTCITVMNHVAASWTYSVPLAVNVKDMRLVQTKLHMFSVPSFHFN